MVGAMLTTEELSAQIASLERGIAEKRASLDGLDVQIAAIEEARPHAVHARDEAQALERLTFAFTLCAWAGDRADAFMAKMSEGGVAREEAVGMRMQCADLVDAMDGKLRTFRAERGSLASDIARDERSVERKRASMRTRSGRR